MLFFNFILVKILMNFIILIIVAIILFFVFRWLHKFKLPKVGSLTLVSGGVKCGKSTLSVALVRKEYNARVRKTKFKNFFRKLFGKELLEMPLIYSNVPLALPYVPLTKDMLLRKVRPTYNCVTYIQEASLVADSQLIRDQDMNANMLLYFKLYGHMTKGGVCIVDTQNLADIHYTCKRSISTYYYIHHLTKIPLLPFLVAHVRECVNNEDNSTINVFNEDVEEKLKKVLIPKSTWKYFDCYCYSVLTDNLDTVSNVVHNSKDTLDLKAHNIVSFRDRFNTISNKCPNCGAIGTLDGIKFHCDYCGFSSYGGVDNEKKDC